MPDFLDWIWMDNTLRSYAISILIVIVFWFLRKLFSRLTSILVAKMFTKVGDKRRKEKFHELVAAPVERFLTIAVIIFALDRLNYPQVLAFNILHVSLRKTIESISIIAIIISFIWLVNRIIVYAAELLKEKAGQTIDRSDDQLVVFFRDFFKVVTWIVGLLLVLKFAFSYNIGNLLTGLSIVGAALALAFRESLENLIASFIIFFDKPFTTGDIVKVENVTGTVTYIGLRSTRIRTTDKTFTTVPNKKMVDNIIDNQSLRSERNVTNRMEFDNGSSPQALEAFVAEANTYLDKLEFVNDSNVYLSDAGGQNTIVQVEYFVTIDLPIKDFFKLRQEVNLSLLTIKARHGLKSAGSLDVHLRQQDEKQG